MQWHREAHKENVATMDLYKTANHLSIQVFTERSSDARNPFTLPIHSPQRSMTVDNIVKYSLHLRRYLPRKAQFTAFPKYSCLAQMRSATCKCAASSAFQTAAKAGDNLLL
jgi:hypothetical protein